MRRHVTRSGCFVWLCCLTIGACREPVNDLALVDVGGHRLNVQVSGTARPGVPAVVFESGLGSTLDAWGGVPSAIARSTRVVAYERAGVGASDPGHEAPAIGRLVYIDPTDFMQTDADVDALWEQAGAPSEGRAAMRDLMARSPRAMRRPTDTPARPVPGAHPAPSYVPRPAEPITSGAWPLS